MCIRDSHAAIGLDEAFGAVSRRIDMREVCKAILINQNAVFTFNASGFGDFDIWQYADTDEERITG